MTQFMPLRAEWDPVAEMDASKHLLILRQGAAVWNAWRQANPYVAPFLAGGIIIDVDLSGADLSGSMVSSLEFRRVNLHRANLAWITAWESQFVDSDLREAFLEDARLRFCGLRNVNLARATITRAELSGPQFVDVDLSEAKLAASTLRGYFDRVQLVGADLSNARFVNARLSQVQFDNVTLSNTTFARTQFLKCTGLERVLHLGACEFGLRTIEDSPDVPLQFWESAGVAPAVAAVARSFKPSPYCSCFISYAAEDNTLVNDLYGFLRSKGVQCWKADRDLLIGDLQREAIFNAIGEHDRLVVVISSHSVKSDWVMQEVERALGRERESGTRIILPIRIGDAALTSNNAWVVTLRDTRNIGDLTPWNDVAFRPGLEDQLLRALERP